MHPRSTTARFAALVFLLQLAAAAALLLPVRALVRDQVYASANATADMIRQDLIAIRSEAGASGLVEAVTLRARTVTGSDAVLLLTDAHGRAVAGNIAAWPAGVALDDRQPGDVVAVGAHLALGFGEERIGDTCPAMSGRDVDLLGLVVGDHDEARHLPADDGNGRVLDAIDGPDAERLVRADRGERGGLR